MNPARLQVRVARRSSQGEGICALELESVDGQPLPAFSAGSHIDLFVDVGLVRQYSLCNAPTERGRYEIAVLRDAQSRGGSRTVHERIREGDVLTISPPRNHFALADGARRNVLLAGGIGVTPLLSMVEHLSLQRASFELHYCVRSLAHVAFADRLAEPRFAGCVHLHADDAGAAQKLDVAAALDAPDEHAHAYVCGPGGFIDWVMQCAREHGWQADHLHYERFSAPTERQPRNDDSEAIHDRPFDLVLARTGRIVHVSGQQSAAQALVDAGIDLPLSCEQGVCGTCLTPVLDGEIDHRDLLLTDAERALGRQFTPCCSRARSARLVIDL